MKYSIFCDESNTVQGKYMVLGGIILPQKNVKDIEKKIKAIKMGENFDNHEIKFSKLNNTKKLLLYQKIIEVSYLDKTNDIDFRCVIFDNEQVNHKKYDSSFNDGIHSDVRGFYKQYYQLLKHQFCNITSNAVFDVFLDQRSDPCEMYKNLRSCLSPHIRSLRGVDSKNSELVQLADLLVGSVSYEKNKKDKKEKLDLIEFIKINKKLRGLSERSYNPSFKVWHFDYNKSKKPASERCTFEILEF